LTTFMDINNTFFFDDGFDFVAAKESDTSSTWTPYLVFGGVTIAVCSCLLAFAGWSRSTHRRANIRVDTSRAPTASITLGPTDAIAEKPKPRPTSPPPMAVLVSPNASSPAAPMAQLVNPE